MKKKSVRAEEIKNTVLRRFAYSENWRRTWDDKWLRWYKQYRGVVPKLAKGEERSNLHIPYVYSTVDTTRSKLLAVAFSTRPYIGFVPKDANDVDSAKNMEKLVDFQLSRADAETMLKFYKMLTDMLIYGACPFEVGWRYEEKVQRKKVPRFELDGDLLMGYDIIEEAVALWDDPDFQPFMIDDFYPDPDGTSIDDCAWVIRRRYLTEPELRKLEAQGVYKINDYDAIRKDTEINTGRRERLAAIGATQQEADSEERRIELLEMWQDNEVVTLCNRTEIIRHEPNPFWHGKKPFGMVRFDPLNGEFYGISMVEVIEYLQAELNTTRNQRIDAVTVAINRMYSVLKSAGVEPADLVSRANGIIWLDRHEDVRELNPHPVDPAAFTEESIIKMDIQEATGTYAEMRGAQSPQRRTATENAIRERAVMLRFEAKAQLFETLGLKRLGFFFDQLNQQFIDDARNIRHKATDGAFEWHAITPQEISGSFEYIPAGTAFEPTLDSAGHRQNILILYDKFRDDPEIKSRELKKKVFEAFGMKDFEKLLKTDEEMQAAAAAAGQQAGMGVTPEGEAEAFDIEQMLAGMGGGQQP